MLSLVKVGEGDKEAGVMNLTLLLIDRHREGRVLWPVESGLMEEEGTRKSGLWHVQTPGFLGVKWTEAWLKML